MMSSMNISLNFFEKDPQTVMQLLQQNEKRCKLSDDCSEITDLISIAKNYVDLLLYFAL